MSGHSKWHNIQGKKGKADSKRGKVFTKIGKELIMAAKGGPNPDLNAKLRDAIVKAKAANLPMDNITRAIKKGSGEADSANYEEMTYEGYGPGGVALVVQAMTDNKNRTVANVRHAFDKCGGNMGTTGSVTFMFSNKGQLIIEKTEETDEEEIMMMALEAGAEDFNVEEEIYEVITAPEDFYTVKEELEKHNITFLEADLTMIPNIYSALDLENSELLQKLLDRLEDDEDVDAVYHNGEFHEDFEG